MVFLSRTQSKSENIWKLSTVRQHAKLLKTVHVIKSRDQRSQGSVRIDPASTRGRNGHWQLSSKQRNSKQSVWTSVNKNEPISAADATTVPASGPQVCGSRWSTSETFLCLLKAKHTHLSTPAIQMQSLACSTFPTNIRPSGS